MNLTLDDLAACFEGVIPSVISTVSGAGKPNISYLSHVVRVDALHVALSNQFFGKTGANLKDIPRAMILLVDGRTGEQYRLETLFVRSETAGPVFERTALHLNASSAQIGMADVMRLRAVDVFLVTAVTRVPTDAHGELEAAPRRIADLCAAARIGESLSDATDLGEIVEAVLDGLMRELGCHAASVLLCDLGRPVLTTIGSRGYGRSGIGSEIAFGDGVIGAAAETAAPIKISDMSRVRRFGEAVQATMQDEGRTRTIALPGLSGAMSQIAMPILFQKRLVGVLLAESRTRLAFSTDDEALLNVVARLAGAAIMLCEMVGAVAAPIQAAPSLTPASAQSLKVIHHAYDDSVFIEDVYVIKGVAGRLLILILQIYLTEGRVEFTNRELRLNAAMRLPDFKDNLETRLLLLRRRLDEKQAAIRLIHVGRGQLRLDLHGRPVIRHV